MDGGLENENTDKYFAQLIAESDKDGDGQVHIDTKYLDRL